MLGEVFLVWFLTTAISGIIANRADAKTVSFINITKDIAKQVKDGNIVNSDMQKAVQRSFLLAHKSICESCLNELKPISHQQKGNFQLSGEIEWLKKKQFSIENELKAVEKAKYNGPSIDVLNEIELLLIQEGDSTLNRFQKFKSELIEKTIGKNDSSKCYKRNVEDTLLERMRDNFAYEIENNQAVHNIFEGQLLVQTDIKVDMIVDYAHKISKAIPPILEKLDKIDSEIQEISKKESTLQHFITLDAYLGSSKQRYWPKWKDVEDGRLYQPENCLEEIEKKLHEKGRCMITGVSGSGKTAIAIAFGLWWRDPMKRNHLEANVFYLDADIEERGEDWYREILTHDYQNEIYIIDNCHLNAQEVNTLCFQLELKPPKNAFVLLISAPRISESPWEDEPEDYFDHFEQAEAILPLHPEQIYKEILQTYSDAYRRIDPQRFIPIEKDLSDSCRTSKLEQLCSHNLVVASSMLEAWREVGGWLSDITEEVALEILARRYLSHKKAPALAPLCSIGQFDIPIHNFFIRQLPQDSVDALLKENLISPEDFRLYGSCHKLSFHPQVAALIFRAYIYQQIGSGYERRIDDEILKSLKKYLSSYPENFILVYSRLYRTSELQHRLLCDDELQNYAAQQFTTRPLNEVIQYLYALYKIHPDKTNKLLQDFVNQITIEKLREEVLALTGTQFCIVSLSLTKINLNYSLQIFGKLPVNLIFKKINYSTLSNIGAWIRPTSSSIAAKLGYSIAWRRQLAKMFDLDILVEMALKGNPHHFNWFLHALIDIDREQARLFLDKISPETLGKKFSGYALSLIQQVLKLMKKLEYNQTFQRRFVETLDQTALFDHIQDASLQEIFWFLRDINEVSTELAESFLTYITPVGLVKMLQKKHGTAQNIMDFLRVSNPQFKKEFLQQLNDEEIATIFRRSSLKQIGSLLQYHFRLFEKPYSIFATQSLPNMIATQRISEISTFIHRLQRVPTQGQQLAVQALELLLKTDLTYRVAESDVEKFSLLLFNAYSVDPSYPNKILSTLAPSGAVEKALLHSGIRGIQLLVRNLFEMAPEFIPRISQNLQTLDLSNRIKEAEIKDLGYFLWNIQAYIGEEFAKGYCRIVDANIQSKQIADCNLTELGSFLWNLVHISDMDELRILNMSVIKERLVNEWENNPGQCISIFGIFITVSPEAVTKYNLSAFDVKLMSERLTIWLTENLNEGHPYTFALTVKSLQVLDEGATIKIIENILCEEDITDKYKKLFRDAMAQAITPRSITVLEEVNRFITSSINNK